MNPLTSTRRMGPGALALVCAAGVYPATASASVLIDSFRGQAYVPMPLIAPYYNNNVPPGNSTERFNGVQRLLSFAATPANRATAVAGTTLTASWPDLTIPNDADVLCEGATRTDNSCQNRIQGAVLYTAVLMPAQGSYTLSCPYPSNDGAIVDLAPTQGTDYRNLGYSQPIAAFCSFRADDYPYGTTGTLASPAPNTLVNLRLAWNNWGNDASLAIRWQRPGGGAAVPIPASNLYDPSDPATYLTAADDDFTGTPITAGGGTTTPSVFDNDRVNVATPVSAGAGGTTANIQSYRLLTPPAGVTINADGSLTVGSAVAAGNYTVRYEICRTDTLPNPLCAEASVQLAVDAAPVVTPVPTLSELATLLLGTLTALGAVVGLRRRERAGR